MTAPRLGSVALDVTPLGPNTAGIGRYTYELLDALWRIDAEPSVVPVGNRGLETARMPARPGASAEVFGPRLRSRAAWTFGALPWWLPRNGVGAFHGTSYYAPVTGPVPTVITIHDLSVFACSGTHPRARVLRARTVLGRVANHASAIITPSAFSASEVVRWLHVPADRIHVVPGAAAASFGERPGPAAIGAVATRLGLRPGFLLCVGTVEPRKNLVRVIDALGRLRAAGEPAVLVVVGRLGWRYEPVLERVRSLGLSDAVRFVGYLSDDDLRAVMALASALVYPSLYEGFGLPVVEAMAAGLPVITSNAGALAEVAGDAAVLVDPLDTGAIAGAMGDVGRDGAMRDRLRRAGLERARALSWDRSARATLAVYAAVLGSAGRRQ